MLADPSALDRAKTPWQSVIWKRAPGMAVHIVTQFGFDGASMLKWIALLRAFGIEHPVRIGLAGPTNLATLLRYAQRCGVRASAQGLARQAGLVRQLFAMSAPDALLRVLAEARAALASEASGQRGPSISARAGHSPEPGSSARADLGDVAPHFFSFGGLARTARWAQAVAERRIAIEGGEGFRVEPPRQ
jgi:methylenetetrahydrofolate reductase (NADH)